MDTNRITGLALAIPPIGAFIIWIIWGVVLFGGVGPDTPQEYIVKTGENVTAVKILFPLVTLLFLLPIAGVGYIKKSMEGGPGSYIAGFAWLLIIIGFAAGLAEVGSGLAMAESSDNAATAAAAAAAAAAAGDPVAAGTAAATAAANSAIASSMFANGQAIGAVSTAFSMLGFALFGVGVWQAKNFSPIIAGLLVVAGLFTVVMCLVDYESILMGLGYLGIVLSFVGLGVSLLTKKG